MAAGLIKLPQGTREREERSMDLHEFEDARPDLESVEGSQRLGRRTFLIGALATGAAVAAPVNYAAMARKGRIPAVKHAKFDLGVASGFPRPRGIELWTRLGEIKRTSKLSVVVTKDPKSPVGRFKTAPPLDSNKPIRIGFYSCQHYEAGFYNAQRALANEP